MRPGVRRVHDSQSPVNHSTWLLVLDALATFRLTRLLSKDDITFWLREDFDVLGFIIRPGVLFSCEWCTSVWVGAAVVGLTALWSAWVYVAAALAFSAIAGLISERT